MARWLAWATACALGAGCASPERAHIGFPILPPVEGGDPSVRREQTLKAPTRLLVKRNGNHADVSLALEEVEIDVGMKMIVGTRTTTTVLPEEEIGVICLTDGPPIAGGIEVGPGAAEVQVRVELFETDIPAQHLWQPTSGKYRVLREWRLTGSVPAR